jgi:hypothetical protein
VGCLLGQIGRTYWVVVELLRYIWKYLSLYSCRPILFINDHSITYISHLITLSVRMIRGEVRLADPMVGSGDGLRAYGG